MDYLYYPGCSLEGTSREYDMSARALLKALGIKVSTIDDWTCCGATAAESLSELLSLVLPARNLALAEKINPTAHILVPCSACYLNLKKTKVAIQSDKDLKKKINAVLSVEQISLQGSNPVRHVLDILSNDADHDLIRTACLKRMAGRRIAPYYGCQCLRPFPVFDDPEDPRSMEGLIRATGAAVFEWEMGGQCCGASHSTTQPEAGLTLVERILASAKGADAIVTVCPMCQMNLESRQKTVSRRYGTCIDIPVLFLPQFLGLAMNLPVSETGLDLNLSDISVLTRKTL